MAVEGQSVRHTESRIFGGFRSLGHVSNEVPALIRYIHRRRENFIVTVIGKSFNTYASQKLRHLSVSGTLEYDIGCIAVDTYHVYTGSKNKIYAWRRGTEVQHVYLGHDADITLLLPFGNLLISIDDAGKFCVFDIKTEECVLEMNFPVKSFKPTTLMHPATYVNKVLIGSEQGRLELWNISKAAMIHHFEGWSCPINQIVQAPAVNIVAIALRDRSVKLFNLLYGEIVMELKGIDEPISMAFRTDGIASLLVGGVEGSITLWDLESRAVISYVENVHQLPVTGLQCFPQEPIFITSSRDNSLKAWIFDMPDGSFRLLNSRDGHSLPSTRIRFHGTKGYHILSAGEDASFRIFHIYNETYNRCLSKSNLSVHKMGMKKNFDTPEDNNRMPPVLDFTSQTVANPSHHDDIAACHQGQIALSTWSFAGTKKGKNLLVLQKYKALPKVDFFATCVCITSCSQFVLVGYSNGTVEKFNIQSALHRKSYGNPAHSGTVRGVAVDQVSTLSISGGSDAKLKFWDFLTGELSSELELSAGVSEIFSHRMTSLIGTVLDDFTIVVVDVASGNIFRRFAVSSQVVSACFSPDNRWVSASSCDCLVRTWDLPTAKMVDVFRLESIVSTMDYSPNGEFLATALHDNIGLLLWMNKTLFVHVSLMPIPNDYLPPLLGMYHDSVIMTSETEDSDEVYVSPEQIDENLITLSLLPSSRWKNLLNLDIIKMRNKPKQPPKTYIAPFFLSSLTTPTEQAQETKNAETSVNPDILQTTSKILKVDVGIELSPFAKKLLEPEKTTKHYEEMCEMLGEMGPSRIDSEIESLGPLVCGTIGLLKNFIEFIDNIIKTNRFFENSQAYLALFLKKHGDTIHRNDLLLQALEDLQNSLTSRSDVLTQQVNSVLAYTFFLKSTLF